MFKVMLVDDEPLVRKGIRTSIDWNAYGIEIVDEAGNGMDALRKLRNRQVDLVLADIRMPIMSGIELSRQIKQDYPDISVALLSGYEDFAYAQAALQIGVEDYMLKPISAENLIEVITKIRDKKKENLLRKRNEINRIRILNENLPYIKHKFLGNLLKKALSAEEIEEKLSSLNIALNGSEYHVFMIEIDGLNTDGMSARDIETIKFAVYNIAEETLLRRFSGLVCYGEYGNRLIGLVSTNRIHSLWSLCEEMQLNIKRYLKLSVTIGIGTSCRDLLEIERSHREAEQALKEKPYQGRGKIFFFSKEHAEQHHAEPFSLPALHEKSVIQHLKLANDRELHRIVDQLFAAFASRNMPFDEIKYACVRLVIILIQGLEDMGVSPESVLGTHFIPYVAVERFDVLEDLEKWLRQLIGQITRHIGGKDSCASKKKVQEAIQYIETHYDQPISLGEVAEHVDLTPAYFSKIFKEETGITFVRWLNRYRIGKAKTLLKETRLKTYEIAERVGFSDYKYFMNLFKKHEGFTPREYRNR